MGGVPGVEMVVGGLGRGQLGQSPQGGSVPDVLRSSQEASVDALE